MSPTHTTTMKAVHYEEPFRVSVREVALPKIEHADDAIIKVTTAGMLKGLHQNISVAD